MARRGLCFYSLHHAPTQTAWRRRISSSRLQLIPLFLIAMCSCVLFGCSSLFLKTSTSQQVTSFTLSISPNPSQISAGQSVQFIVTVVGTTDAPLTWAVNGVTGGTTATGTVSSAGLYLAPPTATNGERIVITATSQAETAQRDRKSVV